MSLKKNEAGVDEQNKNDSSTKDPGEKRVCGKPRLSGGPDSSKRSREERSKGSVDSITNEPEGEGREEDLKDLWEAIAELLTHRHSWVCTISSRLVALYFSQLSVQGKPLGATYLTKPSKLFMLATSYCCQLRSNIPDEAGIAEKVTSDVMQSNLVFTIYSIHASAKKAESRELRTFWSTLTPQEQNSIFKACHLLNGRKGRELINLFTMGIKNQADQANNHDPFNLLVASLLESMGKIPSRWSASRRRLFFIVSS